MINARGNVLDYLLERALGGSKQKTAAGTGEAAADGTTADEPTAEDAAVDLLNKGLGGYSGSSRSRGALRPAVLHEDGARCVFCAPRRRLPTATSSGSSTWLRYTDGCR